MNSWRWSYEGYEPEMEGQREALCTLGNGYVATRGALSESSADDVHYPGTYLAGIYNRLSTEVAGRVVVNESLVNAPNWLPLRFRVEGGEWFSAETCAMLEHHLELDLHRAVLTRRSTMRDVDARSLSVTERRFVSLSDHHLLAVEVTVVPLDFSAVIEVESALDGNVANTGVKRYNSLGTEHLEHVDSEIVDNDVMLLEVRTNDSKVAIAQAARTRVSVAGQPASAAWTGTTSRARGEPVGPARGRAGRGAHSREDRRPATPHATRGSTRPGLPR